MDWATSSGLGSLDYQAAPVERSGDPDDRQQCWRIVPGPCPYEALRADVRAVLVAGVDNAEQDQLETA